VADLDATTDHEPAVATRAGIARNHVAQVRGGRFREVAAPVHADVMRVHLVGPADEVAQRECRVIGMDRAIQAHRAEVTGFAAGGREHGLAARHAQRARHPRQFLCLDRVEFVVPAQRQRDDPACRGLHQQELQRAGSR